MLQVRNISKHFAQQAAVKDVTFSVQPGTVMVLLGPNGSGKTTVSKLVAGLLTPTTGSVLVHGADMHLNPTTAKRQVGYVPDNPVVWGTMTGYEFLHFSGALYGLPERVREERIDALVPYFDLAAVQHIRYDQFSRGYQQKFGLLAALLHQPAVLILDEPIVGLDPDSLESLILLIEQFTKDGGSVLLTTHTLSVAERVAKTYGFMYKGELLALGSYDTLCMTANMPVGTPVRELYQALGQLGESRSRTDV